MKTIDAFAELGALGKAIFTTADASARWRVSPASSSKTLARLAEANVIQRVRQGVWSMGADSPDVYEVAPVLVRPLPTYVSTYSALFQHGMIGQIPRATYSMSLGRPLRIETSVGVFIYHHINEASFGGFVGQSATRSGLATREKALVDTALVLGVRSATITIPEIDLPAEFNVEEMWRWVRTIPSARMRTIVTRALVRILESGTSARSRSPRHLRPG